MRLAPYDIELVSDDELDLANSCHVKPQSILWPFPNRSQIVPDNDIDHSRDVAATNAVLCDSLFMNMDRWPSDSLLRRQISRPR